MASNLLEGLNPKQREAVETIDGPLLIVAGPGSGKATALEAHQLQLLLSGGDPDAGKAAPVWRRVSPGS